jgi:hypothetical protein
MVNAFMSLVTKGKAGRTGDTVGSVRGKNFSDRVASRTDIQGTRGGTARDSGTFRAKERKKTKVVAAEVGEGRGLNNIRVEPKGTNKHAGLLGARGD